MDLTVFGENRPVSVAEQSAAGHIDIIKCAVTVQNTVRKKGEFLHFSFTLHCDVLVRCTKRCNISASNIIGERYVRFQHNGRFILGACCDLRQSVAEILCSRYFIAWCGDSRLLRILV